MTRTLRAWLTICLIGAAFAAHAQRAPVVVMNFENIPVSLSTDQRLSAEQVRRAFMAAGAAKSWEVVQKAPGMLEATYWKGEKHVVVVEITYDAEKYSARYVRSLNMKYAQSAPASFNPRARDGVAPATNDELAEQKQREQFAGLPETPYAKPAASGVIHPYYERWLRDLLSGVRAQLKLAESADR